MSASTGVRSAERGTRLPWTDVVLSAIAAVSWALIGMAGTAALGLHLLRADAAGSLGPMTAAVVALGAGGSVTPSGDGSAFGLEGAQARTAIEITPLGVSLVGALLLSYFFLRSLRTAGVVIAPAELLARAGAVVGLFVAMTGGLAWAGQDVVTIDGGSVGLDDLPGGGGVEVPGVGDVGGLLSDRIGDLVDAEAAVGFTVDTAPTLLGGLGWSAGVLLIALLASRRTPLPRGWGAVHRVVRPAASALVAVALLAVAAACAAAAYAAIGDDHPRRIAGAALLGAPNGVWLGVPVGLFVPWDGRASGVLAGALPDPLDALLARGVDDPVTLGRLAGLDGRVWLLGVAAALMILLAGVLTAVRTPVGTTGVLGFAGRCAVRLGTGTALALPLAAWLTEVSADASLSVLGFDAFGAGLELRGHLGTAAVLGAGWGALAGATGALLARATGAAGRHAAPLARGAGGVGGGGGGSAGVGSGGGGAAGAGSAVGGGGARGASGSPEADGRVSADGRVGGDGRAGGDGSRGAAGAARTPAAPGAPHHPPGPYHPGSPYRPPNPDTNPYLQVPEDQRKAGDDDEDVYGAPTVAGPVVPPPGRPGKRPPSRWGDGPPPPPPPPPPAPPRRPKRGE